MARRGRSEGGRDAVESLRWKVEGSETPAQCCKESIVRESTEGTRRDPGGGQLFLRDGARKTEKREREEFKRDSSRLFSIFLRKRTSF